MIVDKPEDFDDDVEFLHDDFLWVLLGLEGEEKKQKLVFRYRKIKIGS